MTPDTASHKPVPPAPWTAVFEHAFDAMVRLNAQGRIQDWNPQAERCFGWFRDEVLGQCLHDVVLAPAEHPAYLQRLQRHLLQGGGHPALAPTRCEGSALHRTGIALTVEMQLVGVGDVAVPEVLVLLRDISERRRAEEALRLATTALQTAQAHIQHLEFFDPLTGLPNRCLFLDRLAQALVGSARTQSWGALLQVDLGHFHALNAAWGDEAGGSLLVQAAERVRDSVDANDTVARLGGDDYVVLLQGLGDTVHAAAAQAERVAERVRDALAQPCVLASQARQVPSSIGAVLFRGQAVAPEDLLQRAETALYRAKAAGRNCLRFWDADHHQAPLAQSLAFNTWMRQGFPQQFTLHYQLQVDRAGAPLGAEALLRWKHPTQGSIAPDCFIPLVEETGFVLQLGRWVLETACQQLARWAGQALTRSLTLAVNISARQFEAEDFVDTVLQALERTGAPAQRLRLELTERLLHDAADVADKLQRLRVRGVRFSVDDFGTGYSSLSYLQQLPLEQLKIDQSFVRDLMTDANAAAIARSIVGLGHSLGLAVVAEGVETAQQRAVLLQMQCDAFQGFHVGRPVSAGDFLHQLAMAASPAAACVPEIF